MHLKSHFESANVQRLPAFALLAALSAAAPIAGAQSITVAPAGAVAAIPVDNPWALLALGLALAGAAWVIFRHRPHRALFMTLWGTAIVAAMLWHSPELRAQLANSFTNPAGETQTIPVTPLTSGANITGFSAVDFTNASGVPLKITAIQAPTLTQCFPGGFGNLLPAGAPAPNPPPSCSVGNTLAQNAVCRLDVEAVCRALAAASQATISVTPSSLSFTANGNGVATVTNTSATSVATNVQATIPGGSGISVPSSNCAGALPPGASCTVSFTAATAEGPTAIGIQGDNTNQVSLQVSVSGPTATALSPALGTVAGGTSVTLTGTDFVAGNTSIAIGGVVIPAGSVTVNSATSLTFTTPAHAAGNVAVTVTTPVGASPAVPGGFTYAQTPTVALLNPALGNVAGGSSVTISGTNFIAGDTSVIIDGTVLPAGSVTVNSSTSLTFVTPAHAAGNVAVFVATSGGTSSTVPGGFTYLP